MYDGTRCFFLAGCCVRGLNNNFRGVNRREKYIKRERGGGEGFGNSLSLVKIRFGFDFIEIRERVFWFAGICGRYRSKNSIKWVKINII